MSGFESVAPLEQSWLHACSPFNFDTSTTTKDLTICTIFMYISDGNVGFSAKNITLLLGERNIVHQNNR